MSRPRFTVSSRSRPRCSTRCPVQGHRPGRHAVPRVGRALAALERSLVLVLDDLHAVANPVLSGRAGGAVHYVPAGSQVAVASREEPALPLARWRAQGWVHEVGVADLRLDEQEAGLLLEAAGVELDASEVSRADRADGGLACRFVPRGAVAAGRCDELGGRRGLQRRRPVRVRVLPPRASRRGCRRPRRSSSSTPRCWIACAAAFATPCSRRRGRHACSRRWRVRTASWCRSTGGASGIATTTCSASCCATSSSAASRTWCPRSTVARWPGASPTTCPRRRSSTGTLRARRSTVAGLVDALALPLYYDGRMETLEEWLGWFSDDELARYPALAVYGAWFRVLTGRPAEAERWLALADGATSTIPLSDGSTTIEPWVATLRAHMMPDGVEPALADADLALDQLPPRSGWITSALQIRGVAHALLGATDRATDDLTSSHREGAGPAAPSTTSSRPRHSSRSSRPGREPGARQGNAHGRRRRSSRRWASPTTRRARSRTLRRHASHSTRQDTRTPARRWHAPTVCGRCSTTACPG